MPERLRIRRDGVPCAAQVVEYVPRLNAWRWLDCLGRGHVRPASWLAFDEAGGPRCGASVFAELEQRVREWWVPA